MNWFKTQPLPAPATTLLERHAMLNPLAAISSLPRFTIENASQNATLLATFYTVASKLTQELSLSKANFAYYRDNFVPHSLRSSITNQEQLLDYFDWERLKPRQPANPFILGFRSLYFTLRENIHQLDAVYIGDVNKLLTPFYKVYQYPHYLIWGCELNP